MSRASAAGLDPDRAIFAAGTAYPACDYIDDKEYGPKGHQRREHGRASTRPVSHELDHEQRRGLSPMR